MLQAETQATRAPLAGNPFPAESCARQLTAWMVSIDDSPVQGKRHLTGEVKEKREIERKAREFRLGFLRNLKPAHPFYNSSEARGARGEPMENSQ